MPSLCASPALPDLEAVKVSKIYPDGTRALSGIELTVGRGETMALVGESGCGKTTLLRLFNRMVEPTSGEVRVEGVPVSEQDPYELRRRIGYVQQEGGLLPHWTVERNVALVPQLLGWERERLRARVREVLELVRLDPDLHGTRYPRELSGGQRQRVALARALASDPGIVLLDEPFGALDALTRQELHAQLQEIEKALAKTLVLVTHDLEEAFLLADRIAVMRRGEILRSASPQDLEAEPGADYVERLLAQRRGGRNERGT